MPKITLIANKELAMQNWTKEQCAYGLNSSSTMIVNIANEVIDKKYYYSRLEIEHMALCIDAESNKWKET